ncbi:MAG: ABC transporter permease, partial [Bryobacteraceae bacterium]
MKTSKVRWFDSLRMRSRSIFRRRLAEEELDTELAFHFDSAVARHLAQGLAPEAARRQARIELGGPEQIKEDCRDSRGLNFIENLLRDIAYAWRALLREPGFTLTAAGAIALGVGVNTALFTLMYGLVFRPLPVKDPGGLRNVYLHADGSGMRMQYGSRYYVSFPEFTFMREHSRTAELAAVAPTELGRKGGEGRPVYAEFVSANLLPMLGGHPQMGRFFSEGEASRTGSAPVAILSSSAWRSWFAAAPDVIGRPLVLNRTIFTIIGVADDSTSGPLIIRPDVWLPLTMQSIVQPSESLLQSADAGWLQLMGRRKPGFDDRAMSAEMQILGTLALAAHQSTLKARVTVARAAFLNNPDVLTKGAIAGAALFLAVSLVLLVACSNVANMLLARALSRRREIAIRLSIGAGKARLLQQLLTESIMLASFGGLLGLALAQIAGRTIIACIPAEAGPQ